MNKGFKKFLSVFMCAVVLLTVIPVGSAFAIKGKDDQAYCEIKFKDPKDESIRMGETEEVYLEYSAVGHENYEIVWKMSNDELGKMECVPDPQTGLLTSAKLTGTETGYYTLTAKIVDADGGEIASDEVRIWTVEPDNRTFKEKVEDFLQKANFTIFFTTMFIILPIVSTPVMLPYYIYRYIKERFF